MDKLRKQRIKSRKLLKSLEPTLGKVIPKEKDRTENVDSSIYYKSIENDDGTLTLKEMLTTLDEKTLNQIKPRIIKSVENMNEEKLSGDIMSDRKKAKKNAYEQVKKDVSKWQPIIYKQRNSKVLDFISKNLDKNPPTLHEWLTFTPNKINKDNSNDPILEQVAKLSEKELKILHKLQLNEEAERLQQLRKIRQLQSKILSQNSRTNKIKSKNFRKKKRHSLKEVDTDHERAQERASLKHKKDSKRERHLKKIASNCASAREELNELYKINEKLINTKIVTEAVLPDIDDNKIMPQLSKQQKLNILNNPWVTDAVKDSTQVEMSENMDRVEYKKLLPISNTVTETSQPHFESDSNEDYEKLFETSEDEDLETNMVINEAFKEDNVVVKDFISEMQKERDDKVDRLLESENKQLPGWGSWVSTRSLVRALKRKEKRKGVFPKVDPKEPLIISNPEINSLEDSQVRRIPVSYGQNSKIFENSIRHPCGLLWNTPRSFKDIIQPKEKRYSGHIIKPMKRTVTSHLDSKNMQNVKKLKKKL